jgi:archaemetzincin
MLTFKRSKNIRLFLIIFIVLLLSASCRNSLPPANRVFVVQPFSGFPATQSEVIYSMLKKVNPKTIIRKAIPSPTAAFYPQRNRYRADSIINYLNHFASADTVIIGLTDKDISVTKGNMNDWGVMGLGFQPGNACVVSTFRLSKGKMNEQLCKLALHELGHTQGLPHCKIKTCIMLDAEGGNHLDEETGFCQSCKSFLKSKGWRL